MVRNITQVHTKILAYWQTQSSWQSDLMNDLGDQGFHVNEADTSHQGHPEVDTPIDVVMTNDATLGASLQKNYSVRSIPPIFVLLLDDDLSVYDFDWADLVLPPDAKLVAMNLRRLHTAQQQKRSILLQCAELEEQNKNLEHALTRHKRMADQIEILKDAIVRNVSHELKTPLLQVKSAVALLAEDVKDEKLINYAKNATGRLETLVKNITLLGSSIDTVLNPVIVRDSVEYARRNLQRTWEHRDASTRIELELDQSLPPVLADKQGLSTALQLLMDNALKFSEGKITVHAHRVGKSVLFKVQDHGIGIAPGDVHAIFETFYQVDSSSTRRYGGTGIGLAIVRLILENHNTEIRVDSNLGKGSTFSFELPAVDV